MNKWALALCIIALLAVLASAETEQHGAQQTRVSSLAQGGGLGAKIKGLFNKMLGFALKEAKTAMAKLGSKAKATFVLRGTSPAVIPGSSIDAPDKKLKAALKGVTLAASVVPEWDDAATDKHKAMIKLANEFSGPFAMLAGVKKNPIKGIAKGAAKQVKNAAKGKAPIPCVFVVLALKHKKSAGGHGASPPPAPPKGAPAPAPKRAGAAKKKLFMLLEQAAFIKAVRVHRAAVTLQAGGEGEGEPEQHHDDAAAAASPPPAEGAAPPPAAEGTPDAAAAPAAAAEGAPDAAAPAAAEGAPDAAAAAEPSTPEEKAEAAEEEHALTEVDSAFPEPKADEIAKETEPLPEGAKPTKLKGLVIPNLWVFGVEKGKFQILAKAGSINLGKSKHKGGKGKHKKGGKHDDKHDKHDKGAAHHEGDAGKPHDKKKKKKKFM